MKPLTTFLNENTENTSTNEGFVQVAGGVLMTLLGLKIVKELLKMGANKLVGQQEVRDLHTVNDKDIPEMERILRKYPNSEQYLIKTYGRVDGSEFFANIGQASTDVINDIISQDNWNEDDALDFVDSWNRVRNVSISIFNSLAKKLGKA